MRKATERRVQRAQATTNQAMARSDLVIWCCQPEHMPTMIDLLIAQGRLSESDRAHCVHCSALEGPLPDDAIAKAVDADEMLKKAGVRTEFAQAWEALMQGADALDAYLRERCPELDPAEIEQIRQLGEDTRRRLSSPPA
jgi:hypothetical protein